MNSAPTIAIDCRSYDRLNPGNGQYRYMVGLIGGLAELKPELNFLILGTRPEPVSELSHVFADSRWRYLSVPRLTGKGSIYREQALYFRLLRKLDIHLLHTLHTFVPIFPPVPVVESVLDMMFEVFPEYSHVIKTTEYRMHKWAFRRFVTRAIAISETTKDDLENLWSYPADRIDMVYLGDDGPQSVDAPHIGDGFVVLSPFNLEPRKNLLSLLEAAAVSKLDFKLVLYGRAAVNQRREQEFRDHVRRLNLENRVTLTGYLSDAELEGWYCRADIFIFPSLYEGFGLPLLEAMRAGSCVIAHNSSAMAEVAGDCGLKIDMNSVQEIKAALERCLLDSDLRRDFGSRAAERARSFSRERMARETLAVYRRVLNF